MPRRGQASTRGQRTPANAAAETTPSRTSHCGKPAVVVPRGVVVHPRRNLPPSVVLCIVARPGPRRSRQASANADDRPQPHPQLTRPSGISPLIARMALRNTSSASRSMNSGSPPAMCGVNTTFSPHLRRGEFAGIGS